MICVTGNERTPADLVARIEEHAGLFNEARLDLLDAVPRGFAGALPRRDMLVVACRPRREGGGFDGSEEERAGILIEAALSGAAYVDVELSTPEHQRRRILDAAERSKIIVSVHLDSGLPSNPADLIGRMEAAGGRLGKLVVKIEDAAEMGRLLDLREKCRMPLVVIGAGDAGIASRILYKRFGSPFTYVASKEGSETAAGQPALARARLLGVERAERSYLLCLLGGRQAVRSRGMRVYNAIFEKEGLPFVYLPFPTEDAARTVSLLRRLGFRGSSVTMPHKEAVVPLLDRIERNAARIGAVNTVANEGGWLEGFNTDYTAVAACLGREGPIGGETAVVLGAGGAARAAAFALLDGRCRIVVLNRTPAKARDLAALVGGRHGLPMDLEEIDFDVLVNATPVGSKEDETPVSKPEILAGKSVLDMVSRPAGTKLLREARAAGAQTVSGVELWAEQGAKQMRILAGLTLDAGRLLREAEEAVA